MTNTDIIIIREKTTSPIPFTLYSEAVPIDLTSSPYITLNMVDSKNKVRRYSTLDSGAILVVGSSDLGYVSFTPPDEETFSYDRSPYKLYCWVNTSSSQKYSVPRDSYATIQVLREY
jgi:hypothetical protein